jgi:colanic acid/amylovoran biosynthesis glycosyltransferase
VPLPSLRLLVVASTFPAREGDGTPPFVRDLADYEARRFDTLVLVPRVPGAPRSELVRPGLRIERFPYFPRRWEALADGAILENLRARPGLAPQAPAFLLAEMASVRGAVRSFRPHVAHLHWILPQGLAGLVAAPGLPFVASALGADAYALQDPVSRALKRAVLSRAAAVTTMSSDMRTRLLALGAPEARTHVLPVGADLPAVRRHANSVRKVPGRILFAGRLVEKKGLSILLRALRELGSRQEWSLHVVGDGPLRESLTAEAHGLPVTFRGKQPREDLARAMASAELAVFPSVPAASGDQDGLPVALVEAMGLECCVVASRLPGIDTAIESGRTGTLVPPGDPSELAAALAELLNEPERRRRLGKAAGARAEEFSVDAVGARFVELLEEAATGRR